MSRNSIAAIAAFLTAGFTSAAAEADTRTETVTDAARSHHVVSAGEAGFPFPAPVFGEAVRR